MIFIKNEKFFSEPYESEEQLENDVWSLRKELFGGNRIYLNFKKKIGIHGKTRNIPDGYLIDLTSFTYPKIYIVENELAIHGLKHIATQLLEFSLSFDSSKQKIKSFIRDAIYSDQESKIILDDYITKYNFQNIDYFIDKLLYPSNINDINVVVVIDQIDEELEIALKDKFKFTIEIIVLEKYANEDNNIAYLFEPFLSDFIQYNNTKSSNIDSELIDTIVVPAQEEGFNEVFLGENRWWSIRIHSSMINKIKYIAAYQVAPESAITHYAEVLNIEPWQDTNKYVVNFKKPAEKIKPVKLVPKGKTKALQNSRYTLLNKILEANNLDEAF